MEVLDRRTDVAAFFERLPECPARALLLDYDGTLAPFGVSRASEPYAGVRESLSRIAAARRPTLVAVVSGRALRDLAERVGLSGGVELWGSHGLERKTRNGEVTRASGPPGEADFLREACDWICAEGWEDMLERKPRGMAIHGRGRDPARYGGARSALLERWQARASALGLETLEFDGGMEFRPREGHKGLVVDEAFARLGPDACVAYLGDDRTDEDAFAALRGRGLAVLVRPEKRPTAAQVWIRPPEELLAFLAAWERAVGASERT
jgi:trehalose 6-phosphate phosphatase